MDFEGNRALENNVKNRELIGTLLVVLAGISWGMTGIFVRYFSGLGLSSLQITVFKIAFAALAMLAYCLVFDRDALKIKKCDIWVFAGAGFISMDFFTICYFSTIQSTSLSVAAVLLYLAPAIVMLMSIPLFGEKISALKCVSCALAFAGCVLTAGIIGSGTAISASSLVTGVLSAFGYALYSIFGQISINRGYGPMTMTTYTFLFATVGTLFLLKPAEIAEAASKTSLPVFIGALALMSAVVTLIPYTVYTIGLTYIRPSKASIIASVEPVTATIVGAIVFKEFPDVFGIIGIVCVLGAVVLLNIRKNGT